MSGVLSGFLHIAVDMAVHTVREKIQKSSNSTEDMEQCKFMRWDWHAHRLTVSLSEHSRAMKNYCAADDDTPYENDAPFCQL